MNDDPPHGRSDDSEKLPHGKPISQDFSHQSVTARIPEKVSRGVFSTGIMVLQTSDEFALDFLSTMVQPHQIVARVILTANTLAQLIAALRANLAKYEEQFGRLTPRHAPPTGTESKGRVGTDHGGHATGPGPQTAGPGVAAAGPGAAAGEGGHAPTASGQGAAHLDVSELYEQLKLPDDLVGGVFANVVMIRHTAEEFEFDFIANFYPRSVVTARIYLSAGRLPAVLETLSNSFEKYRQKKRHSE
jgi:hypothetical protein